MRTFFLEISQNPPKQNLRKTKKKKKIVLGLKWNAKSNYMMFHMPAWATLQWQVMKNYAAYLYNISMYSRDLTQIWNTQFDVVLVRKHWWKQLSEWPDVILVEKLLEHWQLGALLCFMNTENNIWRRKTCLLESIWSLIYNVSQDLFLAQNSTVTKLEAVTKSETPLAKRLPQCLDPIVW